MGKIETTVTEFGEIVGKNSVSTGGAIIASVHWSMWEPVAIQFIFIIIDLLRQKYIKKDRVKDLEVTRREIQKEIHENCDDAEPQSFETDKKNFKK